MIIFVSDLAKLADEEKVNIKELLCCCMAQYDLEWMCYNGKHVLCGWDKDE
jgi:hypothetical protein